MTIGHYPSLRRAVQMSAGDCYNCGLLTKALVFPFVITYHCASILSCRGPMQALSSGHCMSLQIPESEVTLIM